MCAHLCTFLCRLSGSPSCEHRARATRPAQDEEFEKGRDHHGKDKAQWKFLQKYYHRGAYFQEEDETGNNKLGTSSGGRTILDCHCGGVAEGPPLGPLC